VLYREARLAELEQGRAVNGPLRWEGYGQMRGQFARGLEFERTMVARLRADAALPRAQRQFLKDFNEPRIETHVGVAKRGASGIRYADVLVIDQQPPPGQPPRVETFSFKSRNLAFLDERGLMTQMTTDASEALRYYGETLNIRRPTLELLDIEVQVHRVRLIYEGGGFEPSKPDSLRAAVNRAQREAEGVEVSFQ
jgi:hypothetical protein